MITVTKPFLPAQESLNKYISKIYKSNWLTNFGPLERELTDKLKKYLGVNHLLLTSNGTLALQVLYKALGLSGEIITTPFSFVATTSTIIWENLTPNFVDIDKDTFNINPELIEKQISNKTSAILPVHVFGRACNTIQIQEIATKHKLKLIYDAAHAFNIKTIENKNILEYGDASILSFHATKLFHTIEGGAIIANDENIIKECKKLINFGITGFDNIDGVGINCKMNEFSAAMGLATFENIDEIMLERQRVFETYNLLLNSNILPINVEFATNNYSYYPTLLPSENSLLKVRDNLLANEIMARRYFYPSLNTLNYIKYQPCPISEDISKRILCLPMYPSLTYSELVKISDIVNYNLK